MSILKNYRVLDCSIAMAGPFAAQRLGDMGADVIKIEPVTGEWQRHVSAGGSKGNKINTSFLCLNRNKRSLAVNLKSEQGKKILYELVKTADVFIQNYRAGVAERLGLDYETLTQHQKNLVYVSMSGYGESGPYTTRPGQDMLVQALSGAMYSTGSVDAPPAPSGQYVVDATTAYTAFEAVLGGLLHRERTGEGQLITVNMLDSIIAHQVQELTIFSHGHIPQKRTNSDHGHVYIRAPYGIFQTENGYIALATPNLKTLGELIDEPAFLDMDDEIDGHKQRDFITNTTRKALVKNTSEYWLETFDRVGIWCGPVHDYQSMMEDPQVIHNKSFVEYDHPTEGRVKTPGFPINFTKAPCAIFRPTPQAGEHTHDILSELGIGQSEIQSLNDAGVIKVMEEDTK
ncbi:CoA transferase [Rhodobacteraceae bacterium RKSG542]|uniref:CaiB/BaiF CoA transferase family protein n=1 Tax=Pseudovibrio flavus TaxID=2529854 RepID=UPI0012BC6CC2|nr:CoA transferase [Pseudovibrio flavus]MTI15903.1 CoA transferase [Pseudovibrio flavus]